MKKGHCLWPSGCHSIRDRWRHQVGPSGLRSDIKEIAYDLPTVHGFDIGHIELEKSIKPRHSFLCPYERLYKEVECKGQNYNYELAFGQPCYKRGFMGYYCCCPCDLKRRNPQVKI